MGISDYGSSIHDDPIDDKYVPRKHEWLPNMLEAWTWDAVRKHFPEDTVLMDASMAFFPNDTGSLLPVVVVYIQINGTDEVDGLYLIDTIAPSLATEETITELVDRLAVRSRERRGEIRNALRGGARRAEMGIPSLPDGSDFPAVPPPV